MITVFLKSVNEKYNHEYEVFDCNKSIQGGGGRPVRTFGVCLVAKLVRPVRGFGSCAVPERELVWIDDYGSITKVTYNRKEYDFKKEGVAEMFYNAIKTELALEEL